GMRNCHAGVTVNCHLAKRQTERTTHHVPFSIFHFRTTHVSSKFILYYNIKINTHIHDALLRTNRKRKMVRGAWCVWTNFSSFVIYPF
ncbi:MAG: hypothetical protein IKH80_06335, partial [Bacteroidaceae bacterium]|nr:hypothetical protein [Bacteroidaceae bacterium]